jgi:SpoVK/Ycf46/Vps4 family AAA+-type ATPase
MDTKKSTEDDRDKGFRDLVIPESYKSLLKAMVKNHSSGMDNEKKSISKPTTEVDLVRGKGRGLIIFLYGPPGVGKTSTAETIAAYTTPARPLYPITCGDLGSTPTEVERNLEDHFKLAHRWNCVLLLDEADVYIAERDFHDLNRNGIVSVFLRTLEYYSGILFLTSNREGLIDEAFKSRIHIALHYKPIDRIGTRQIWTNIMNRMDEDNQKPTQKIKIKFERMDLLQWSERHFDLHDAHERTSTWNGRQIRNAFQTALALASYDRLELLRKRGIAEEVAINKPIYQKVVLKPHHFDKVAKVVQDFEAYRKFSPAVYLSTDRRLTYRTVEFCRGKDEENVAHEAVRRDDFDPSLPPPKPAYQRHSSPHVRARNTRTAATTTTRTRRMSRNDQPGPSSGSSRRPAVRGGGVRNRELGDGYVEEVESREMEVVDVDIEAEYDQDPEDDYAEEDEDDDYLE